MTVEFHQEELKTFNLLLIAIKIGNQFRADIMALVISNQCWSFGNFILKIEDL